MVLKNPPSHPGAKIDNDQPRASGVGSVRKISIEPNVVHVATSSDGVAGEQVHPARLVGRQVDSDELGAARKWVGAEVGRTRVDHPQLAGPAHANGIDVNE